MAGAIDGLFDLTQGTGLDIKPYVLGGYARDIEAADRVQFPLDAGVDIFYRVTANLVSSTTFNTDFAETEVDTRQVNLTRFSLFFPEKRPFFLEDAGVFDFGIPRGGGRRGPPPDIVPFFSRRIGLVEREPVPIRVGQKLTGKVGNFDVGVLNVVTGDTDHAQGQNLFVARTKANFWAESYVGALVTHGDPTGVEDNSLVGMDMRLATSDFLSQGKILALTAYGSKTQTPSLHGQDNAYGFEINYPERFRAGRIPMATPWGKLQSRTRLLSAPWSQEELPPRQRQPTARSMARPASRDWGRLHAVFQPGPRSGRNQRAGDLSLRDRVQQR